MRVAEITINPNYTTLKTGIALLRMEEEFTFSDTVAAIPLSKVSPPLGAHVEVSGWGRTTDTEENMHRALQIGGAEVVAPRNCALASKETEPMIDEQMLCLGHGRRQGICRGDMGGPAVYNGELVGLGGEMLGECGGMLPEMFVSIAANYEWIQEQLQ